MTAADTGWQRAVGSLSGAPGQRGSRAALGSRQHARPLYGPWLAHSSDAIAFPFWRPENPREGVRGGRRVTAPHSAGLLWRSFHLRAILLVLMNQNVLSVIETRCFLCTGLLGKPAVSGTLWVWLKGTHSSLRSTRHPWPGNPGAGWRCPAQLCARISRK